MTVLTTASDFTVDEKWILRYDDEGWVSMTSSSVVVRKSNAGYGRTNNQTAPSPRQDARDNFSYQSTSGLTGGLNPLQLRIAQWFRDNGIATMVQPVDSRVSNLTAEIAGAHPGANVWICAACAPGDRLPSFSALNLFRKAVAERNLLPGRLMFTAVSAEAASQAITAFRRRKSRIDAAVFVGSAHDLSGNEDLPIVRSCEDIEGLTSIPDALKRYLLALAL